MISWLVNSKFTLHLEGRPLDLLDVFHTVFFPDFPLPGNLPLLRSLAGRCFKTRSCQWCNLASKNSFGAWSYPYRQHTKRGVVYVPRKYMLILACSWNLVCSFTRSICRNKIGTNQQENSNQEENPESEMEWDASTPSCQLGPTQSANFACERQGPLICFWWTRVTLPRSLSRNLGLVPHGDSSVSFSYYLILWVILISVW